MRAKPLRQFAKEKYGNFSEMGRRTRTSRKMISDWAVKEWVVIDGWLYARKRRVPAEVSTGFSSAEQE